MVNLWVRMKTLHYRFIDKRHSLQNERIQYCSGNANQFMYLHYDLYDFSLF